MPSLRDTRRIGSTALRTTVLGYGSAPLGNRFRELPEDACHNLVDDAWARGIRLFDTAPMYGHGLAENRLGTALRSRPRDDYLMATKVGRLLRPEPDAKSDAMWINVPPMGIVYDYSYDGTMRSIEDSLQRMLTDRIDIVFIHDCDRYGHGDNQPAVFEEAIDGATRALTNLRDQKVIGAVGMGVNEADVCVAAAGRADFDVFLLAGRYTLLEQGAIDDLLPLCAARKISLILGGVFNSGILAAGATSSAHHNYAPAAEDVLERVRRLESVCERHGITLAAAALQFVLAPEAVSCALVGASTVAQQASIEEAFVCSVPADFWNELRDLRLIRDDVPIPSETGPPLTQ